MDIFEFALEKEKLSEDYYRQLQQKTSNKGLSNIFLMLAEEEKKHGQVIRKMRQETPVTVTETDVLRDAAAVFERMRESAENFDVDITELQLYEKAREIEKTARQFYLHKAAEVTNDSHREIFRKLADEERKHYMLLDRICAFVEKPKWFLENAEIYHFDDYADGVL